MIGVHSNKEDSGQRGAAQTHETIKLHPMGNKGIDVSEDEVP